MTHTPTCGDVSEASKHCLCLSETLVGSQSDNRSVWLDAIWLRGRQAPVNKKQAQGTTMQEVSYSYTSLQQQHTSVKAWAVPVFRRNHLPQGCSVKSLRVSQAHRVQGDS